MVDRQLWGPTDGLGGSPDPGHLCDTGPWVLIWPEAVVDGDRQRENMTSAIKTIIYLFILTKTITLLDEQEKLKN